MTDTRRDPAAVRSAMTRGSIQRSTALKTVGVRPLRRGRRKRPLAAEGAAIGAEPVSASAPTRCRHRPRVDRRTRAWSQTRGTRTVRNPEIATAFRETTPSGLQCACTSTSPCPPRTATMRPFFSSMSVTRTRSIGSCGRSSSGSHSRPSNPREDVARRSDSRRAVGRGTLGCRQP